MKKIPSAKLDRLVISSITNLVEDSMDHDIYRIFLKDSSTFISYNPKNDRDSKWGFRKMIVIENDGDMPSISILEEFGPTMESVLEVIPIDDWPEILSRTLGTHLEFTFSQEKDEEGLISLVAQVGIIELDFSTCLKDTVEVYKIMSR